MENKIRWILSVRKIFRMFILVLSINLSIFSVNKIIILDPTNSYAEKDKIDLLHKLSRYEEELNWQF